MKRVGRRLAPEPIPGEISVTRLVDDYFLSYNAARLREACQLFVQHMLQPDVLVGVSLSGALTPTGLGVAALVPLIQAGFVDWIVSTGANLYHDLHRSLGFELHGISPLADDVELRERGLVRIYDILFEQRVLFETDHFLAEVVSQPEFQRPMGTAELHHRLGRYLRERERVLGIPGHSVLSAAFEAGVPVYSPSPGDSGIGMNIAAGRLRGNTLAFDVERDVNETAALVYHAKKTGGRSAVLILGGGSPKNFILQTEPHIQEILGLPEAGHDYFIQITDARPDTGGLSGATPGEAVTWGKIDPEKLPDAVVCYCDTTIALPILAAYALANAPRRPHRRLFDRRESLLQDLAKAHCQVRADR